MSHRSIVIVVIAALVALGGVYLLSARATDPRDPRPVVPYPKATPPPPASDVFAPAREPAPSADDIERESRDHVDTLVAGLERAVDSHDPQTREVAFTFVMPELVQSAPQRVVALIASQAPGEARDVLRTELARQWITWDRDAAIEWMKALDEPERRAAAMDAVHVLAPVAPDQAIYVADQFGIGRDDGYLERLVLGWSQENLRQVDRWLATQPEGPNKAQLRARVETVRERKKAG